MRRCGSPVKSIPRFLHSSCNGSQTGFMLVHCYFQTGVVIDISVTMGKESCLYIKEDS